MKVWFQRCVGVLALRCSWRRWLGGLVICLVLAACLGLARRSGVGNELRLPATDLLRSLTEADLPSPIENRGHRGRIWAIRAPAHGVNVHPAWAEAVQLLRDVPHMLARSEGDSQAMAAYKPDTLPSLFPLLQQDGVSEAPLYATLPAGSHEPLDGLGRPLRWQRPGITQRAVALRRPPALAEPTVAKVTRQFARELAKLAPARNADNYRALVENFARRYNLSTELVMAIIHSESNFTPTVVSPKSAMGLMQLLPSTASDEVHRFLYGHRGNVSFAQLAVPEINIRYGTAYLHILNNRYFSDVRDSQVREACVIASYNLGPNRFLKLYGPNNQQAVQNINRMTPEEFHADLPRRLPVRETRFYVEKVKRMKQHYAGAQKESVAN